MKKLLSVLLTLLVVALAAPLWAGSLSIAELAVTTKVSKGKPIDAVHRISHRTVKALYCFTRTVSDEAGETTIKHVWMRNGQVVKETDLPVKGKRWRFGHVRQRKDGPRIRGCRFCNEGRRCQRTGQEPVRIPYHKG